MVAPEEVTVWIGLDVGKDEHFADVLNDDGESLFARSIRNDEAALDALIGQASEHGTAGLVIDQPGSIAQLAIAVAARRQVPVAYVPGLVMRRAADLYPGEAKTDRRDAFVIADTARTRRTKVHWLDTNSDELLEQLRVLNGFDIDLAADVTRVTNRLRDLLVSVSPALERAIGSRLHQAGVRALIAKFPTPTALRSAGRARINRTIKTRSPRLADKVTDTVIEALDAQTVVMPAESALGRVIAEVAVELDRLHTRRDALAGEIEEVFLAHPFGQLLQTLPGIGPRTGARILAEIGDGTRFADASKLASYAGLAPRHPPVRHVDPRRVHESTRQPQTQERHVPRRVRIPAVSRVESLLRPETSRGQEAQRRDHLPRPPPHRRHLGHAPRPTALPATRRRPRTHRSRLNP